MPRTRLIAGSVLFLMACGPACAGQNVTPRGERYAVLIGVRDYVNKELKGLNYVEPDIVDLAKLLLADGYRPENVMIMSQSQSKHSLRYAPEGGKIMKELKELLRDKKEGDTVLIAFTGHGVQFRGEEELYLCPADARLTDRSSLIGVNEVYKQLEDCKASFKLLLVDACRNDPLSNQAKSGSSGSLESLTQPPKQAPPGGVMAFYSCSAGEQSFEHERLKHGVFFNFIIDALRGSADFNNNGQIEIEELVLHVRTRVNDYVRANLNNKQRPEFQGKFRDGVLATVSKTRTVALSGGFAKPAGDTVRAPTFTPPSGAAAPKSPANSDLLVANDHLRLAKSYLDRRLYDEALEECDEALKVAKSDDSVAVRAYYHMAEAYAGLGDETGYKLYREMGDKRQRNKK